MKVLKSARGLFKMLANWLKRFFIWLWQARILFVGLAAILGCIFLFKLLNADQDFIKYTGLVLQVLGLLLAWIGIEKVRGYFNQPGSFNLIGRWLKNFPQFRRQIIHGVANITLGSATLKAYASQKSNPLSNKLKDRVTATEKNIDYIFAEISSVRRHLDLLEAQAHHALEKEKEIREQGDKIVDEKLEVFATGGLGLSLLGMWFILLGIIMSTMPEIIVRIFSAQ